MKNATREGWRFACLSVVETLDLVFRLAADIDAEAAVELNVLFRDNDGEVSVAALEGGEILFHHGGEGIGKAGLPKVQAFL